MLVNSPPLGALNPESCRESPVLVTEYPSNGQTQNAVRLTLGLNQHEILFEHLVNFLTEPPNRLFQTFRQGDFGLP